MAEALRPIAEIIKDLSCKIPQRHIRTKEIKNNQIQYITWYTAVRCLDHFAPGWSCEVRSVNQVGDKCVCVVRLSIPCAEGVVWREATGIEDDDHEGFGDPASNAEAMALKRAASKLGLGLHLYDKHNLHTWEEHSTKLTEKGNAS